MSEALKNNGSTQSTISRQYKVRGRPNRLIIKESLIELFQIFVDMTLSHEFEAPELGRPETGKSSSVVLSERKISSFEERVSGSKTTSKPTLMSTSTSQQVVV